MSMAHASVLNRWDLTDSETVGGHWSRELSTGDLLFPVAVGSTRTPSTIDRLSSVGSANQFWSLQGFPRKQRDELAVAVNLVESQTPVIWVAQSIPFVHSGFQVSHSEFGELRSDNRVRMLMLSKLWKAIQESQSFPELGNRAGRRLNTVGEAAALVELIGSRTQLTREGVAKLLGVSRRTLYNWLTGDATPGAQVFGRIEIVAGLLEQLAAWRGSDSRWWLTQGDPSPLDYLRQERWDEFEQAVDQAAERGPARRATKARRSVSSVTETSDSTPVPSEVQQTDPGTIFKELAKIQHRRGASIAVRTVWRNPEEVDHASSVGGSTDDL
jgi:transcriptional regulator with XRE-family HTH domain